MSAIAPVPADTVPAGHEDPSVDTFKLLIWAGGLAFAIAFGCLVSHLLFNAWLRPQSERSITPLTGDGLILPANPRLEGIEMTSHAPSSDAPITTNQMNSYGWVDREKGIVRIPIGRAMQLAIERNWLPSASPSPATTIPERSPQDPSTVAPASSQ